MVSNNYYHNYNYSMVVYTLQLKNSGDFDGLYYQTKSTFGKRKKLFTKKEISSHLNRAIKTASSRFGGEVKITTHQVVEKDSFSVSSLEEFKTFEKRMTKIEELLNKYV